MKAINYFSYTSSARRSVIVLASLLICIQPLNASTIYSKDFTSNKNGWFNSGAESGLQYAAGYLRSINSTSRFLTHFDSTTLAVNESMTVNFDLLVESVTDAPYKFRIGILDSGGSANQVTADNYGSTNELFTNYGGYRLDTNIGANSAGNTYFSERRETGTSLLGDGMFPLSNSANGVNLTLNTTYATSFVFTRTDATTLNLSFSLNGVTLMDTDTTADTFTFDTLAFYEGNVTDATQLDNVVISVIPEPGTLGLVLGALLICFFFRRR